MKPSPHENPELTAYALGELHAHEAGGVHDLLSACPVAAHDLEQIEAVTDALRQGAPIPLDRLRPEQRHTVLRPTHLPRRITPLQPRPIARKSTRLWPIVSGLLKAAAMIAVAALAYSLGRHADETLKQSAVANLPAPPAAEPEKTSPQPVPVQQVVEKVVAATPIAPAETAPVLVAPEKPEIEVVPAPALLAHVPEVNPAPQPVAVSPAPAAPKPSAVVSFHTTPSKSLAFVSTLRQTTDEFALRPANIRPAPPKVDKADLMASPVPIKPVAESKDSSRGKTPDLYIHSWKAEVASCPWSDAHRLLRVTIQLPADQPAAVSQSDYPLRVTFDPNNVREYRQLCERHQVATELRHSGTHVVWYEFLPNGTTDGNKTIATVTLPNGRFTTQTVGPFDASKLRIQDNGQTWQSAREDYVFESSLVGFGLLLRGGHQIPHLNHELVLALAEKAKGTDATGERQRFIRLVKEVQKAAGL